MKRRTALRYGSFFVALVLGLTLVNPGLGFAAQDEPPPEQPAEPAPAPAASPTPDRAPSYQRGAPAGALRLTGDPPAVGPVIVEDPLTAPGLIPGSFQCESGRNKSEFVGEGFITKVTGRCTAESTGSSAQFRIPDLQVPDGEVRLEAKVVSGHERAGFWIGLRVNEVDRRLQMYDLDVSPALGRAWLERVPLDAPIVPLASRADLAGKTARDDWNTYAIRLDGTNLWVLLDDTLILSASDSGFDRGGVSIGVYRRGDPEDNAESAVVFRNLRISRLAPKE